MTKFLGLLQAAFSCGRGRPVALLILVGLLGANLLGEMTWTVAERGTPRQRWADRLGAPFHEARQVLFDAYQRFAPRQPASNPVTIVAIDEQSLKQLGQWPWPRNRLAALIEAIAAHRPAAIGLDIYMPEADQTSPGRVADNLPAAQTALAHALRRLPSHDARLAAALRAVPSVLGAAGFDFPTYSTSAGMRAWPLTTAGADPLPYLRLYPWVLASLPELQAAARGQALLSVDLQSAIVRQLPLVMAINDQPVSGLAMEMLRVATDAAAIGVATDGHGIRTVGVADLSVPTQPNGEIWLHFARLATGAARYVAAADVLAGKLDADLLNGKLVLIGLTGSGLADQRTTVLDELVPGIEIQAQLLESIFDGRLLLRPWWLKLVETLLLACLGGLLIYWVPRGASRPATELRTLPRAGMWGTLALGLAASGAGQALFVYRGVLFDAAAVVITLSCAMGSLVVSALIEIGRQGEEMAREQQRLREQEALSLGERNAAWRIQLGSLPKVANVFPAETRFDMATLLEPARDVGGDLYDFFMIDARRLGFVVGDVSGKGLPASIFMAVAKTLAKTIAQYLADEPGRVAELTNAELSKENPEMLFVTALIGVLDIVSGELALVNAGHDGPWRIAADGRLDHIESPPDGGGPPLCVLDEFPYQAQTARLRPGDTLCMITDGITEAMNAAGEIYGAKRLEAVLAGVGALSAQTLIDRVRADVARHVANAEASDDMTLLVIRWTPETGGSAD